MAKGTENVFKWSCSLCRLCLASSLMTSSVYNWRTSEASESLQIRDDAVRISESAVALSI